MQSILASHQDLLKDETRAFAFLATTMPDGTPQLKPLWFSMEREYILINSAIGRINDKNMRTRPSIALLITDPEDPFYRYLQIRGSVVQITEEGGDEHIHPLSLKYDKKPWKLVRAQTRVIYMIEPEKVFASS